MDLRKRGGNRRIAKVGVVVFTLAAFQVLAVIGAGVASAATCSYDSTLDKILITVPSTEFAALAVEGDSANLDPAAPDGAILFSDNGGAYLACGSATTGNTTIISVLGQPSTVEAFTIDEFSGDEFPTTIQWGVDLGTGAPDFFQLLLSEDINNTVVLTDSTFVLNGGGGDLLGEEVAQIIGNNGNDTIDGSALSSSVRLFAFGNAGDDTISPGAAAVLPNPGDLVDGGSGLEVNGDTLSYGTRTTSVVIDAATGLSGHSANADCDVVDPGDEQDVTFTPGTFENLQSGSANDCIVGNGGTAEYLIPGDGDDTLTGQIGADTIDWSSSSAGLTITPAASASCTGTATGQGTDTWTGINGFAGSAFDDTLIWTTVCPTVFFSGGDGVDTVDATAQTSAVNVNLDNLDPTTDDLENLLGGGGSDTLTGNDVQNHIEGNAGNDNIFGAGANDTLIGGLGNDQFDGGAGADTVSFATNTTDGVNVDLSLGFATSAESGDDGFGGAPAAITGPVEIIVGSPFDDTITGGGGLVTINFLFKGGAGEDILTGSGSNDTLKGGGGDDVVRANAGDDTLGGAGGDDLLVGGTGFDVGKGGKGDDTCKGVESRKSCQQGKARTLNVARASVVAKLV